MIEDKQIEAALAVLLDDAEAKALYRKMRAEHLAEATRARAFMAAQGPIEERKAKAILDPDYQEALHKVATAAGMHRKAQTDRDGGKYVITVWEQEGHNARQAERIR